MRLHTLDKQLQLPPLQMVSVGPLVAGEPEQFPSYPPSLSRTDDGMVDTSLDTGVCALCEACCEGAPQANQRAAPWQWASWWQHTMRLGEDRLPRRGVRDFFCNLQKKTAAR